MDLIDVNDTLSDGECEDDGIQRLVEGLDLKSIAKHGSEFSVKLTEEEAFEEQLSYKGPKLFDHLNMDCIGLNNSNIPSHFDTPFAVLALKMKNLTPDGKVKKRLLTEGYGEPIPPKAVVWFHHDNYVEMQEEPFDSSYLRGPKTMVRLQSGKCIIGLDIGLSTMKVDELAEFLIHPDYAYGKMGVSPRIPPDAHVLIRVKMIKFIDNALALKMGEYTDEELKALPFDEVLKGALSLLHSGKHHFSQRKYQHAVYLFEKAVHSLENCTMTSDEDDAKNEKLRLRLFTNLGVIHNKIGRTSSYKRAITVCRKALNLSSKDPKVLYHLSLAHLQLGGLDEARKYGMLAKKYAPYDVTISALLERIDTKLEKYRDSSITFARNVFKSFAMIECKSKIDHSDSVHNQNGNFTSNRSNSVKIVELEDEEQPQNSSKEKNKKGSKKRNSGKTNNAIRSDFELEAIDYIKEFVDDPTERQLHIPSGLTFEEERFIKKQAVLHGLHCQERHDVEMGRNVLYIIK